jgi:hypothetical protein
VSFLPSYAIRIQRCSRVWPDTITIQTGPTGRDLDSLHPSHVNSAGSISLTFEERLFSPIVLIPLHPVFKSRRVGSRRPGSALVESQRFVGRLRKVLIIRLRKFALLPMNWVICLDLVMIRLVNTSCGSPLLLIVL